jgi:leucyl aminopeptidase
MNFELKSLALAAAAAEKFDALVVLVPEGHKPGKDALSDIIGQATKAGDLETKAGKLLSLYKPAGVATSRVVLVGAGDGSTKQLRQAVAAGVGAAKGAKVKRLGLVFADGGSAEGVRAAVVAAAEASYVYTTTKSKSEPRSLQTVTVGVADAAAAKPLFERAVATVAGVELAKEWANRPANHATPSLLAQTAQAIAKAGKMKCEVLDVKDVAKLGMGSFMAVAQGSAEPLRFIVLQYQGGAKGEAPTVLVGKGITFDSGGISIKPAPEMDEMKFDMSGAASVLGVFKALGELKPALNVVGLIPACENLLDGKSIKPGDVVTSMSGQTIEILNTDAEGRLILCDALSYAERFKPRAVVDIATLTGACMIALGGVRSGLFASTDELATQLSAAGDAAGDLCWRLPLDDDYAEGLKTNFADVANVAGRAGGAITAAKFLQRFVGKFPWAHLDIAGTAWKSGAAKGATGRPVGLLLEYLLASQAGAAKPKPAPRRKTASA